MKKIKFNKGIDYWNGNYYPELGLCFTDMKTAVSFGHYFCAEINKPGFLGFLCESLYEAIRQNPEFFSDFEKKEEDSFCFENKPVEYIPSQQYIRFPDFKHKTLQNYLIRMDINPCVGKRDTMTKIYSIPRYTGEIGFDGIPKFVAGAQIISEKAIELLTNKYIEIYNQFITEQPFDGCQPIDTSYSKIKKKIKIISLCVGSDERDANVFFENAKKETGWEQYCKKNKAAQSIFKALEKLSNASLNRWNLSEYEWFLQDVIIDRKTDSHFTLPKEVKGYLGVKREANIEQYIGFTNSTPRDILLPINLNLIRTDMHRIDE